MLGRTRKDYVRWISGGEMKRDYGTKTEKTVGPQASSALDFLTRQIFKTSTLEACGPTVFSVFVP